jgi:PAS domain S-box-containing protein
MVRSSPSSNKDVAMPVSFEIRLVEALDAGVAECFPSWTVRAHPAGGVALRGTFPDQEPLFTALEQVRALGLTLLSVVPALPDDELSWGDTFASGEQGQGLDAASRSLFNTVSDGLAIRDHDGVVVEVNPAFCALYGYSREELLGNVNDAPLTAEERPVFERYLATVNAGGVFRTSGWQRNARGERIHVEMRAVPFTYRGAPHILDLARDTTEQMRAFELAEQRAGERARELAVLLEVSRQVASTLDLEPLLRLVLAQLRGVLPFDGATFNLREGPDELRLMLYEGPIPQTTLPEGWSVGPVRPASTPLAALIQEAEAGMSDPQAFGREVIYSGAPVIIPDVSADTPLARAFRARIAALLGGEVPEYIGCWMGVPMVYRDEVIGMLDFDHTEPGTFTERHARLAMAATSQAAIAITNARLLAEVQGLAAEEERQRLARELHDAVTQQLFSASIIGEVLPQIWATDPVRGAEYLEDLRLLTKGALAEMRALLVELRPAALTDTPLPDLLQQLASALAGRIRAPVELRAEGAARLPDEVQVALYRVAQEALQNVARHARATHVWVTLRLEPGLAELSIRDDGRGFDPATVPADHFGLAIMRERMESVGGTVAVESQQGQGTTLTARWVRA